MIDSLNKYLEPAKSSTIREQLDLTNKDYAVLTLHRPSNVDNHKIFSGILRALAEIAARLPIIFPVHPRTRKTIAELGLTEKITKTEGLRLIEPLGYLDFLSLYGNARLVLTDSGGIQEETTVAGLVRRPEVEPSALTAWIGGRLPEGDAAALGALAPEDLERLAAELRYAAFVTREEQTARRLSKALALPIPPDFAYRGIGGLSR